MQSLLYLCICNFQYLVETSSAQASVLVADLSLFISSPIALKNSFVFFIGIFSSSSLSAISFRSSTKSKWFVAYIPESVGTFTFLCIPLSCLLNGSIHSTKSKGERLSACKIPLPTDFSRMGTLPDLILYFHLDMMIFRKLSIHGGKL
jgi:hypothetical protein